VGGLGRSHEGWWWGGGVLGGRTGGRFCTPFFFFFAGLFSQQRLRSARLDARAQITQSRIMNGLVSPATRRDSKPRPESAARTCPLGFLARRTQRLQGTMHLLAS